MRGWVKWGAATSVKEREEIWALNVNADWTVIDTLEAVTSGTKMANHSVLHTYWRLGRYLPAEHSAPFLK